ncbi:TetR/AcrR family transcriptional regulator [Nocardia sp. NPDC058518]|uniref:TetR/AcrR family transcriptional regulator n=1 Tax=Nocardia sp. NPDC058518 TaxID=3346534 RepID=UPI00364B8B31
MSRSARYRPVQRRSQISIDKILDATARLLVRDGYQGLTTNHIAVEADLGIGTVYRYFADKNELLAALRDRATAAMTKELIKAIGASLSLEPAVAVRQLFICLVDALERDRAIISALASEVPMGLQSNILPEVEGQIAQFCRLFIAHRRPDLSDTEVEEYVYIGMTLAVASALRIAVEREPHMDRQRLIYRAADVLTAWLETTAPTA